MFSRPLHVSLATEVETEQDGDQQVGIEQIATNVRVDGLVVLDVCSDDVYIAAARVSLDRQVLQSRDHASVRLLVGRRIGEQLIGGKERGRQQAEYDNN